MTPLRLAMWSGPRNISTAMLRSFGSRSDTFVTDEPLYASYLSETGLRHPMTDEILASQANDWREVAEWLSENGHGALIETFTENAIDGHQLLALRHHHMREQLGMRTLADRQHLVQVCH